MEKYYFKQCIGSCLEECRVKSDGTKIGSVACQECEHCTGVDPDFADWIICNKIEEATKKS